MAGCVIIIIELTHRDVWCMCIGKYVGTMVMVVCSGTCVGTMVMVVYLVHVLGQWPWWFTWYMYHICHVVSPDLLEL